ncbi:uncharacterized protein LOC128161798 isoform X2 [Crassostrea angulata]|uniref:uncharacterized protein LOC128161798 isoform X2 n=1 Tax=Magallana angulata TaxID=2784310 RepID=UPI0022B0ABC4|nr:uncharacterized protein LOC128161798 isoform X2 [Crassostrea angulata]
MNMDRGLYWFTFVIVTSLTYDVTVSLQCPTSADAWERASLALQCKLPNSYHCLKDEKNVITEQCLAKVWIEGEMCPVYSSRMSKIDVIECSTPSCPQSTYWSNSVFLYPVCFETKMETLPTTTLRSTIIEQALTTDYSMPFIYSPKDKTGGNKSTVGGTTSMKGSGKDADHGNTMIYIIGGICSALVLILGITVLVVCRRRKRGQSRNHDMLENYMNDRVEQKVNINREQEEVLDDKVENASTEKSSLMSKECSEESRKPHLEDTKVYVASGPNLPRKAEQSDAPQILLLVQKNPLEKKQIDEHANRVFGSEYVFCWTMSYYQKHKREEQASVLVKDFDFKSASLEEILKKLLAVVAAVETRVAFVVAVPLETWSLNRENISQVKVGDNMLICKTEFV